MIEIASKYASSLEYSRLSPEDLRRRIGARKRQLNAVILGHNYQRGEIQAVSDFLGDSLGLSQEAAETDADVIVFCGVHFMAETAKILSPGKTVLMPDPRAGCPMADYVTAPALRRLKEQWLGALTVCYVNSTAEVKAESDICCTSSNAVAIVHSLPENQRILFVPDRNLAAYVSDRTGRPLVIAGREVEAARDAIIAWDGFCYVHDDLAIEELAAARAAHPQAKVVLHPEARPELLDQADFVASTARMVQLAEEHDSLIIGTERGLVDQLAVRHPLKTFVPVSGAAICGNMKLNTLAKLAWCLDHEQHEITVPEDVRQRAEDALRRMLDFSGGWQAPTDEEERLEAAGLRASGCGCA